MTQDEVDNIVKEECSVLNNVISLSAVKHERQRKAAVKDPESLPVDNLSFRIERIKKSVDRINDLMAELRGAGK
jgi:hypothetical protein